MTTVAPPPLLDDDEHQEQAAAAAPAAADPDPEAPYGRNPRNGKPYQRSPEWRAKLGEALNRGRQTQSAAPGRKATPRKAASKPAGSPDYRPGVMALIQIPAFALGIVGRSRPAFALDAATLTLHAPIIAEAVHQTALVDDRAAAILDKVLQAGPYGALLGALVPLALQIAANHKAVPVVPELGILTGDQLVEALQAKQ